MTNTAATIGWISQNAQQMPGQPNGRGLADYANPLNSCPVPNPPTLDGMFAPPLSPTETIRILRELLADAGRAIALRDLQISALRLQLNVATGERDAAIQVSLQGGHTVIVRDATDPPAFPARALRGGDGVPR